MKRKYRDLLRYIIGMVCSALFLLGVVSLIPSAVRIEEEAHASEPEQTYVIHSAEEFIAYSRAYASGDRNPKDVLVISINSGNFISANGFISLGTAARPFAGTINIPTAGVDTFLLGDCPLFDYVSTDMTIAGSGIVKIKRQLASDPPEVGVLTSGALFANHVVADESGTAEADWKVSLLPCAIVDTETPSSSFSGVIGDIAANCVVSLTFTDTSDLSVSGSGNTGLICGTLNAGATLSVSTAGSGSDRTLTAGGNAGGLVGETKSGATLQFDSTNNTRLSSVTATNGYAGGIVGKADCLNVLYGAGVTDYTVSSSVTGTTGAGGLYGYYKTSSTATFGLDAYTLSSGLTVSSSGSTGGVFGYLDNVASSFTFDGNASGSEVFNVILSSGSARGGVCGRLKTNALTDSLTFTDVDVTLRSALTSGVYSGGVIGIVTDYPAYLSLSEIAVTASSSTLNGGLIGTIGSGGSFVDVSGSIAVVGHAEASLVGNMPQGILRLQGTTDLSTFNCDGATFVKNRNRSLIYALGDGTGTNGNWTLKRYLVNACDDVGSWGQVIRTDGVILAESDLFTVNMTAHTVTVKGAYTTMDTLAKFALTALNIKLNTGAGVGSLLFTSGNANLSSTLLSGTLTLGADLSLTGTGLLGLTRDDGNNASFSGTFAGSSHTLTLATGERYGLNATGGALSSDSKQGNIYHHGYTGLFAKTNGATVSSLTLAGIINVQQKENEMKAGGFTAYATGSLTINALSASFTLTYKALDDLSFYFGGAVGYAINNNLSVSVTGGTLMTTVSDVTASGIAATRVAYMGGAIGAVFVGNNVSPTQSVSFSGATVGFTSYTKSVNTNRESAFGVIAYIGNATYVKGRRTVSFEDSSSATLTVSGTTGNFRFGGILGVDWLAVDVTIDDLTVDADVTATGSSAGIGGLCHRATGGWKIDGLTVSAADYTLPSGCSFGFVSNLTSTNRTYHVNGTAHTHENALYLSVDQAGYDIAALAFTSNTPSAFDELVADSRYSTNNVTSNGNSVVSVTTSGNVIATSGSSYNTYHNQTAFGRTASGETNGYTRYYYNVDYARANTATAKYNFFVWSLKQYAHGSLSAWFTPTSTTFSGSLDMTGISYYPIDLTSAVTFNGATLKLDHATMNDSVKYAYYYNAGDDSSPTRTTLSSSSQHYHMHTSVFRNVTGSVTVTVSGDVGLTMQGNVPKIADGSCGFLISGTLGNSDVVNAKLTAAKLTFDGVYITLSGNMMASDAYAPLFINKIGKNTNLNVSAALQYASSYSSLVSSGKYAASSLIGDVGGSTARAIYLTFTGLVFDGRQTHETTTNMDSTYHTDRSIFKRATLLNSFWYSGESSGSYNFPIEDDWSGSTAIHQVTYGQEISTTTEYLNRQNKYYSSEYYVDPVTVNASSAYDFGISGGFLPYVYTVDLANNKHELAINVTFDDTIEGCGMYNDPFIIDNNTKLEIIAKIINGVDVGAIGIYLPSDLSSFDWTASAYAKYLYTFNTSDYTSDDEDATDVNNNDARRYLAGAYYVVTKDITLSPQYPGLGVTDSDHTEYAFRGIIIGRGNPTVTNTSASPLIHTSHGSVIQNLTLHVDSSTASPLALSLAAPQGNKAYNYNDGAQFYGAVIGQILGGDNFIDSVQVTFGNVSFSLTVADSSYYERLVPVGGYVGVIVNGGLIFRNMTASNVGLTSSKFDKVADSGYLYVNPIIGRVIAGYAFHETTAYHSTESTATLKNGEKNYTICDLSLSAGALTVSRSGSQFVVSVPDGQALFVLAAIVNSGAASASYHSTDEQPYNSLSELWSAYRAYTTTRGGSDYSTVGTASGDAYTLAQLDEHTDDGIKIPYIIRAYSNATGGVYLARAISSQSDTILRITGDCDVAESFRGIGSIYIDSTYVHLGIASCSGWDASQSRVTFRTITFHMNFLEYNHKSVSKYIAYAESGSENSAAGFGLFTRLTMNSASSSNCVQYLTLSGSIFYDVYTIDGEQVRYNFANYKNSGSYDRTETGNITSGDSEYVTQRRTLLSVGGIAGFSQNRFYIKNVTFNDLYVEGAKTSGGLIGFAFHAKSNNLLCTIQYETSIVNAGFVNVVGGLQAGGLIGRLLRVGVSIIGADGGTDIIVRNVESKNTDPNESNLQYYANLNTGVGGLVGTCWAADGDGPLKPTLSPAATTNVRQLFISNVNVVKGTNAARVRVLNDSGTKNNYAGGFIGSAHNVWIKIENCKLQNVDVTANIAGGLIGIVTQKYYLYIKDCSVEGSLGDNNTKLHAITGTRYAGGAVGWAIGRDIMYFQLLNYMTKDYAIVSTTTSKTLAGAGGAVGYAQGDNKSYTENASYICEFNNITILNCEIATNYAHAAEPWNDSDTMNYKCGTGGLIGVIDTAKEGVQSTRTAANKYKFSGFNILIKDTLLTHLTGGVTPNNTADVNRRIGDLVGNNAIQSPLWFVGVAVQYTTAYASYCGKHVGYYASVNNNYGTSSAKNGYVVFANYNESISNTAFTYTIGDGSTASDDNQYVGCYTENAVFYDGTAVYPYVTSNPAFTFGGHKLTGDGVADSVANLAIQNIISDGSSATAKYSYAAAAYYTGSSGDNNLTAFGRYTGKLATFTSEVGDYLGTDFPVLILDDTNAANATKMINSYLRLLTNTTYDFAADQNTIYKIYIYKMLDDDDDGVFTPSLSGVSLKRSDGAFYMTNNLFDSGKTQYSLIDLRFLNPADTSQTAYRLFVPVFVKKVLSYQFDVAVESGTTYHPSAYTSSFGEALIENIGSPVTFYFSYTYQRSAAEWTAAINAGENVHRNYAKNLLFYKANTNDILKTFPSDTVLVLVDPNQGGRPYYATIGTTLDGNTLSLSAFRSSFSKSGGVVTLSGSYFSPAYLDSMLGLSVTSDGTLVACDLASATVVVNGQGYRSATEDDEGEPTFTVTASVDEPCEKYYLSMFTESNPVNDLLFHYYLVTAPSAFSETAYPSRITDTGAHTMVHLVMGKIFYHDDFTIASSSELDTLIMTTENNVLTIDMKAVVGFADELDEDIKGNLQTLIASTEVYQSFLVYLNRKDGNDISKAILGSPTGTGTYSVDYVLNNYADTAASAYSAGQIQVTQNYAEFLSPDISTNLSTGNKFEIHASVSLSYSGEAITTQFPGRGPTTPESGVTVSGSSNLAFSENQTTYSKNNVSQDEYPIKSYYSEADPEVAILDLNPIGDKVGDFTLLGINALNNDNSPTAQFELLAVMNVAAITEQITDYDNAVLTVTLSKKLSDASYGEALDISEYLTLELEGLTPDPIVDSGTFYQAVIDRSDLSDTGAEITVPLLRFTVLTGSALEAAGLTYGNYRVNVNMVLRDDENNEYSVTRVSNYVIYTNAKIIPDYID